MFTGKRDLARNLINLSKCYLVGRITWPEFKEGIQKEIAAQDSREAGQTRPTTLPAQRTVKNISKGTGFRA